MLELCIIDFPRLSRQSLLKTPREIPTAAQRIFVRHASTIFDSIEESNVIDPNSNIEELKDEISFEVVPPFRTG